MSGSITVNRLKYEPDVFFVSHFFLEKLTRGRRNKTEIWSGSSEEHTQTNIWIFCATLIQILQMKMKKKNPNDWNHLTLLILWFFQVATFLNDNAPHHLFLITLLFPFHHHRLHSHSLVLFVHSFISMFFFNYIILKFIKFNHQPCSRISFCEEKYFIRTRIKPFFIFFVYRHCTYEHMNILYKRI